MVYRDKEFIKLMEKERTKQKSSIWLINLAIKLAKLLGVEKRNFR